MPSALFSHKACPQLQEAKPVIGFCDIGVMDANVKNVFDAELLTECSKTNNSLYFEKQNA